MAFVLTVGVGTFVSWGFIFGSGYTSMAYMPRETWFAAATTMRPGLLRMLSVEPTLDAFTKQPGWEDTLRKIQAGTEISTEIEREMLPLLDGEMSLAVLGDARDPSVLGFVHTSDPERLLRLWAQSLDRPEPRDRYKGALYFTHAHASGYEVQVIASSKGWVIAGTTRSAAEQAFDRIEGGRTDGLAEDARFKTLMSRLPSSPLGLVYWDGGVLFADAEVRRSLDALPANVRDYLRPFDARSALTLDGASEGLELRWESIPAEGLAQTTEHATGSALSALERMPADTLFAFAGSSLPELIAGLDTAANEYLAASMGPFAPRIEFGFSEWLGGEFAVAIARGDLRLNGAAATQGAPDVLFAAKLSDPSAAAVDLNSLDVFMNPREKSISGYLLKEVGTGQPSLLYGIGGEWLYASVGADVPPVGQRDDRLTLAPNFKLVERAIQSTGTAVYLDLEESRRLLEDLLPAEQRSEYDEQGRVFLQPLIALGGSSRTDPNGDVHGMLVLAVRR